jgi:hypothetical protein
MDEVHDLTYFGGGGFIYSDVWNMPIMTRRYHIRKINDFLEKKREAEENAMKKSSGKTDPRSINQLPDFISKVKNK